VSAKHLGEGGVVFFRWDKEEQRWAYICQIGVGLPALPALVQSWRQAKGRAPILNGFQWPPRDHDERGTHDRRASERARDIRRVQRPRVPAR
jgi:hypothetical protein